MLLEKRKEKGQSHCQEHDGDGANAILGSHLVELPARANQKEGATEGDNVPKRIEYCESTGISAYRSDQSRE